MIIIYYQFIFTTRRSAVTARVRRSYFLKFFTPLRPAYVVLFFYDTHQCMNACFPSQKHKDDDFSITRENVDNCFFVRLVFPFLRAYQNFTINRRALQSTRVRVVPRASGKALDVFFVIFVVDEKMYCQKNFPKNDTRVLQDPDHACFSAIIQRKLLKFKI